MGWAKRQLDEKRDRELLRRRKVEETEFKGSIDWNEPADPKDRNIQRALRKQPLFAEIIADLKKGGA